MCFRSHRTEENLGSCSVFGQVLEQEEPCRRGCWEQRGGALSGRGGGAGRGKADMGKEVVAGVLPSAEMSPGCPSKRLWGP